MTVSSYEGWEATHPPLGATPVVDTVDPPEPKPVTKPLIDMRPIDEFEDKEPKPFSVITSEITRLKNRRAQLKGLINNLKSYPATDEDFPDGTALIWHRSDDEWVSDRHYAAVKENNRWYVTGEFHGFFWDELVSSRLKDFDFSEIEVVRPAEKQ